MIEKIKNISDKPYYLLNTVFCVFLVLCGLFTNHTTDYPVHTDSMAHISFYLPDFFKLITGAGYPLWHITGRLIMLLLSCSPQTAAGLCTGIWLVASYLGVLYFTKGWFHQRVNKYLIALLCFFLFFVGPIWVKWKNPSIILGCGGPNVWHNATNICGRAVGIFAFFFCMKLLDKMISSDYQYIPNWKTGIGLSAVLFFSLFAKPSFIQTFAPAFAVLLIYYLIQSKGKLLKGFGVFCAAAVLPLVYLMRQFLFYFSSSGDNVGIMTEKQGTGIEIYFMGTGMLLKSIDCQFLILMFPMILSGIMWAKGKFDRYNAVVWLMDLFSVVYIQLLHGAAGGEMGWAYYIALFFVYLVGIRDFIYLYFSDCEWKDQRIKKATFAAACTVFSVNLLVGAYYFYKLAYCKGTMM